MAADDVPLESDEFVVLHYGRCDAISGDGSDAALTPLILSLTNRRIIMQPLIGAAHSAMPLRDIESLSLREHSGQPIISVICARNPPLRLLIPDCIPGFAKVASQLCRAAARGSAARDAAALRLRERAERCGSAAAFLRSECGGSDVIRAEDLYRRRRARRLSPVEIANDLIERGEALLFALSAAAVCALSILFACIPFGVCVCGAAFVFVAQYGLRLLFSEGDDDDECSGAGAVQVEVELPGLEGRRGVLEDRFLWRNPRHTLEVFLFLFSTALIFMCYSPALILAAALVVFAYIERWNPFGFGSLSDIITNLFDFS